jgi:hypothetical protein
MKRVGWIITVAIVGSRGLNFAYVPQILTFHCAILILSAWSPSTKDKAMVAKAAPVGQARTRIGIRTSQCNQQS